MSESFTMDPLVPIEPTPLNKDSDLTVHEKGWLPIAVVTWILLVAAGLGSLMMYANRPGQGGAPAANWPAASDSAYSTSKPTLLVFAHPRCPCTRATMDELAWVMTRCGDEVVCQVLFVHPEGKSLEWVQSDLWETASSIPGVNVRADRHGRLAEAFGVETSGHAMLYDTEGKLRFEGGITPSRGHRGSNFGRQQLVALANNDPSRTELANAGSSSRQASQSIDSTCVFGCPLFSTRSSELTSDRNVVGSLE